MKHLVKIFLATVLFQFINFEYAYARINFPSPEDFKEKVLNNLNTAEAKNFSYDFFTCLTGINNNLMVFKNSSRVERIDGRQADCLKLERDADWSLNRYFFKRDAQQVITHCASRVTDNGIAVPYTCNNSSYCTSGCPEVVPEGIKLLRKEILQELQQKTARESQEEKQNKIKQEQEQQAKIKDLRSRKYSSLPAKVRVESRTSSDSERVWGMGAYSIIVTSVDNEPFLLERVVVNNRLNIKDCDRGGFVEYMATGDARQIRFSNCGDQLIKVDVYTNRGSFSYQFK